MAVRNFWIEAYIDGRKTDLEGGPRNKEGGFELVVKQRDDGSITEGVRVTGHEHMGRLYLRVWDGNTVIFEKDTVR